MKFYIDDPLEVLLGVGGARTGGFSSRRWSWEGTNGTINEFKFQMLILAQIFIRLNTKLNLNDFYLQNQDYHTSYILFYIILNEAAQYGKNKAVEFHKVYSLDAEWNKNQSALFSNSK